MTQEELDALMNGELDLDTLDVEEIEEMEEAEDEELFDEEMAPETEETESYRATATNHMPPPATDDNKMVHQLDDVTKESEQKATEIFDIIEGISNQMMEKETQINLVNETLRSNIELFTTLTQKFPHVEKFGDQLGKNETALDDNKAVLRLLQESGDSIMSVMDIMQYQDIHRQKIERVINVMRALAGYMNALFSGQIDDEKRVGSATHLPGDNTTEAIVSNDDIEELLNSFASK